MFITDLLINYIKFRNETEIKSPKLEERFQQFMENIYSWTFIDGTENSHNYVSSYLFNELENIINLYIDTKNIKLYNDFLSEFFNMLLNKLKNNELNEDEIKFKEKLNKLIIQNDLDADFKNLSKITNKLYIDILYYILDYKDDIKSLLLKRIFNNFDITKDNVIYKGIFDKIISNKIEVPSIFGYDLEKSKHIDIYIEYISFMLDKYYGFGYSKEMLIDLLKETNLKENDNLVNKILNKYIKASNDISSLFKDKTEPLPTIIEKNEDLLQELDYILKNKMCFNNNQYKALILCFNNLVYNQKKYINNDNFSNYEFNLIEYIK